MTTGTGCVSGAGMLLLLSAGHFLAMFDRHLLAVVAVPVAAHFQLDDAAMGVLLGPAFALAYGVAAILLGRAADGPARHRLLPAGLLLWTLGSAAMAFAGSFPMLVAARIALGVGEAAFVPAALALIVDRTAPARRARALSWFTTGSTLGRGSALLGGGVLLGLLGSGAGWGPLFLITAIPNLALLAALLVIGRRVPRSIATGERNRTVAFAWLQAHAAAILLYIVIAILPVLVLQAIAAWLPTLFVRGHGLSVPQAGLAAGFVALISASAGQLVGGQIVDRSPRCRAAPALMIAIAMLIGAPLAMSGATAGSLPVAVAMIALANIAFGIASFAGLSGVQALVPASCRGSINGLFMAVVTVFGAGMGPLLAGLLSASGAGGGIGSALSQVAAGASLAALGTYFFLLGGRYAVTARAAANCDIQSGNGKF